MNVINRLVKNSPSVLFVSLKTFLLCLLPFHFSSLRKSFLPKEKQSIVEKKAIGYNYLKRFEFFKSI